MTDRSRGYPARTPRADPGLGGGGVAITNVEDEGALLLPAQPTLDFVGAGVGVSVDILNNRYIVNIPGVAGAGGWQDDGAIVRLIDVNDEVVIGDTVTVGAEKLRVTGNAVSIRAEGGVQIVDNIGTHLSLIRSAAVAREYRWAVQTLGQLVLSDVTGGADRVIVSPADGTVSIPGGGALSERLGAGSIAAIEATAHGNSAAASGANSVAIGRLASAALDGVAIGRGADAPGGSSTAVGRSAAAAGINTTAIGRGAAATGANSIALGALATASSPGQFIIGADAAPIFGAFLGRGATSAVTAEYTLHASGGNAAGVGGSTLILAGGLGGDAATSGGRVGIATAIDPAGTTLVEHYSVEPSGNLTMRTDHRFVPLLDNTGELGEDLFRFRRIRAVAVVSGDLVFEDPGCALCGEPFERGEILTLRVLRRENDAAGKPLTYTIPAHLRCAH